MRAKNPLNKLIKRLTLFSLSMMLFLSCETLQTIEDQAKIAGCRHKAINTDLRKLVGIASLTNLTHYKDSTFNNIFQTTLINNIQSNCPNFLIVDKENNKYRSFLSQLPKISNGQVNAVQLADEGKKLGLNAVVEASLPIIYHFQEKRGIIGFKKDTKLAQIFVLFNVYDVETGTKIFSDQFMEEVEISEEAFTALENQTAKHLKPIQDAFKDIVINTAESACDAICIQPWKTFVTQINEKKLIVAAGSLQGVKQGDEFYIFNNLKTISGINGQKYYMPQTPLGKIKITAVSQDSSEAAAIDAIKILPNYTVKKELGL